MNRSGKCLNMMKKSMNNGIKMMVLMVEDV